MSKIAERDARQVFRRAKMKRGPLPGDSDARRVRRVHLTARNRTREKEVRALRRARDTEVIFSRGDAVFGPDAENWWV